MSEDCCSNCGNESDRWKKLHNEEGVWYCKSCWPEIAAENHCCERCGKPLVAIGDARSNGKQHRDWDKRTLHKKCWKIIYG